jgi:hypothetical protein
MRFLSQAPVFVIVLGFGILFAPRAKADTLDFTITGAGSTYTFSLPSSPTPDVVTVTSGFGLNNQPIIFDSLSLNSNIFFPLGTSILGGGLDLFIFVGGRFPVDSVILQGPQLFTGSEATPTFLTGQFTLMSPIDKNTYSLKIDSEPSPVPEPGSLVLLATGAVATYRSIPRRRTSISPQNS